MDGIARGGRQEGGEEGRGGGRASARWQNHNARFQQQQQQQQTDGPASASYRSNYNERKQNQPQQQQQQQPVRREQGRVRALKDGFGFIACCERPGDLFFHFQEAPRDGIRIGDDVEFTCAHSGRSQRPCAIGLEVLPPGTVWFEKPVSGKWLGEVEVELPRRGRGAMMGNSRSSGGGGQSDQEEPSSGKIGQVRREELQKAEEEEERPEQSGSVVPSNEGAGADDSAKSIKLQEPPAEVAFTLESLSVRFQQSEKVRVGDEVRFTMVQDRRTGQLRASNVSVVRSARSKQREKEQAELEASGADRETGVVIRVAGDFGFICSISQSEDVYFPLDAVESEGPTLREGQEVDFWLVKDEVHQQRGERGPKINLRAVGVRRMPSGSVELEEVRFREAKGTVERSPAVDMNGRPAGSPGMAFFELEAMETIEGGGEKEGEEQSRARLPIHPRDFADPTGPVPMEGDTISADIVFSHRGRRLFAKSIRIVDMSGTRIEGVVNAVKPREGFGFIRRGEKSSDVFFRLCDVIGEAPLKRGTEVRFSILKSGDRQQAGSKERAHRVEVLPPGSLLCVQHAKVRGIVEKEPRPAASSSTGPGGPSSPGIIRLPDDCCIDDAATSAEKEAVSLADELREKLEAVASGELEEYVFGAEVPSKERRLLHVTAAKMGLMHKSCRPPPANGDAISADAAAEEEEQDEGAGLGEEARRQRLQRRCVRVWRRTVQGEGADAEAAALAKEKDGGQFIKFHPSEVGSRLWACVGDTLEFDVVFDKISQKHLASRISVVERAIPERRGFMDSLSADRGFGFIADVDTEDRVFVHLSEVDSPPPTGIPLGQEVSYTMGNRAGKPVATNVTLLDPGTIPVPSWRRGSSAMSKRKLGVVVVPPRRIETGGDGEEEDVEEVTIVLLTKSSGAAAATGDTYAVSDPRLRIFSTEELEGDHVLERGDVVSFSLGRSRPSSSKFGDRGGGQATAVEAVRLEKKAAIACTRGAVQSVDMTAYTAQISDAIVVPLREVVGPTVSTLREGDEVEYMIVANAEEGGKEGGDRVIGVMRVKDLEEGFVPRRRECNSGLRAVLKKSGVSRLAQARMAQGPDGSKGFPDGWRQKLLEEPTSTTTTAAVTSEVEEA
jgi:cold shock CspA family protein